jgi:hypothetical protein
MRIKLIKIASPSIKESLIHISKREKDGKGKGYLLLHTHEEERCTALFTSQQDGIDQKEEESGFHGI